MPRGGLRPYLGANAAAAELERDPPPPSLPPRRQQSEVLREVKLRWTHRTMSVLSTIAAQPGASNRQIATRAGVADQGQASKLLSRLERLGLIVNHSAQPGRTPNVWRLTPKGAELEAIFGSKLQDGGA